MISSETESIVEEAIMVFFKLHDVSVEYVLAFKMFLEGDQLFLSLVFLFQVICPKMLLKLL